jgi:hypothetical protein
MTGPVPMRLSLRSFLRQATVLAVFAVVFGPALGRAAQHLESGGGASRQVTFRPPGTRPVEKIEITALDLVVAHLPVAPELCTSYLPLAVYQEPLGLSPSIPLPGALRAPPAVATL